jgi:integrase
VLPAIGARPLQRLTPRVLEDLYGELINRGDSRNALSLRTVSNIHRTIHKALADAHDAGLVVDNVASGAKAPRPWRMRARNVSSWQPSELARFLKGNEGERLEAVWRLAAMTGMRRGEILGLRWGDLDLNGARLSVHRTIVDVNYHVFESTPKGNAARSIDLDTETVRLLGTYRSVPEREREEW